MVGFLPAPPPSSFLADGARDISRSAASHPRVDLRQLALPKAADSMGRQSLVLDPAIYGIGGDTQVGGDFIHRAPTRLGRRRAV
jgi:hypothetical protein